MQTAPSGEQGDPRLDDTRTTLGGVSVTWLANVFGMKNDTVKRRLSEVPVKTYMRGNVPLFDLKAAAAWLVDPKVNIDEYIKLKGDKALPAEARKEYWQAKNEKAKWEENARELWRTDDVALVFSNVFKTMSATMKGWTDTIERKGDLSENQRKELIKFIDSLQADMHHKLVKDLSATRTASYAEAAEDIVLPEPDDV